MSEPIAAEPVAEVEPIAAVESQVENTPPVDAAPVDAAPIAEPTATSDAVALAQTLGLPLGEAKTVDDVLAALIEHQNAPFEDLFGDDADDVPFPTAPAATNEVEALRTQLAERDSELQSLRGQLEAQFAAQQQQLESRLATAIDRFASPKYGVGRNRTLAQTQQAQAFRGKVLAYADTLARMGEPLPTIEVLAEQVRRIDDNTFKPDAAKPAPPAPLGTPGTNRDARYGGADQPRNIHEAVMRSPV